MDTTPPVLVSISVSPVLLDVSESEASATVTAVATDDLSGVSSISVLGTNESEDHTCNGVSLSRESGDTFTGTMTWPAFHPPEVCRITRVTLWDEVGNDDRINAEELLDRGFNLAVGVGELEATYARDVTLNINARGVADGRIVAEDLESGCHWAVPVTLERRTAAGSWRPVGSDVAVSRDGFGFFKLNIGDRPGLYRVTVSEFAVGTPTVTTCALARATDRVS